MLEIVLATGFFLGIHVLISGTQVRDQIVARLGEQGFLGLFSLLSLGGIAWMGFAYARAPLLPLWGPLPWFRPISLVLMLVSFLLVIVGLTTPSPTATGGEGRLGSDGAVRGILRITRHPFLWGVALWALTHLIANGDGASLILFAGLLVLALIGPGQIDSKRARRFGEAWQGFVAVTSSVPFGAILQGRNRLELGEIGLWRVLLALVLYALSLASHRWLFGSSPLDGL